MKKVIVTGGAGFIGSHIVEELVGRGIQVIVIDNLSSTNVDNIKPLIKKKNLEFINGNINETSIIKKHLSGVDYIFHHAAIPGPSTLKAKCLRYYQSNTRSILNILQAAKLYGVKKVIFASTSAIYGNNPALLKREDMAPCPESPYALTKLIAEYYCSVFTKYHGLPTVCLRYFNVYGPRQNPDSQLASIVPKFMQMVLHGKSPVIFGDGEQIRDFVFVRDVVNANLLAAGSDVTGILNVGTGNKTTLNQLAQIILKLMGREDLKPVYQNERPGDIKYSLADISRARSFGYMPRYNLIEGLREIMNYNEAAKLKYVL